MCEDAPCCGCCGNYYGSEYDFIDNDNGWDL